MTAKRYATEMISLKGKNQSINIINNEIEAYTRKGSASHNYKIVSFYMNVLKNLINK